MSAPLSVMCFNRTAAVREEDGQRNQLINQTLMDYGHFGDYAVIESSAVKFDLKCQELVGCAHPPRFECEICGVGDDDELKIDPFLDQRWYKHARAVLRHTTVQTAQDLENCYTYLNVYTDWMIQIARHDFFFHHYPVLSKARHDVNTIFTPVTADADGLHSDPNNLHYVLQHNTMIAANNESPTGIKPYCSWPYRPRLPGTDRNLVLARHYLLTKVPLPTQITIVMDRVLALPFQFLQHLTSISMGNAGTAIVDALIDPSGRRRSQKKGKNKKKAPPPPAAPDQPRALTRRGSASPLITIRRTSSGPQAASNEVIRLRKSASAGAMHGQISPKEERKRMIEDLHVKTDTAKRKGKTPAGEIPPEGPPPPAPDPRNERKRRTDKLPQSLVEAHTKGWPQIILVTPCAILEPRTDYIIKPDTRYCNVFILLEPEATEDGARHVRSRTHFEDEGPW